jgi:hypothetical protein
MTTARRVGCWDVSRCVYTRRGWRWLWSAVLSCRERVCVCLVVSVVFRLNERPIHADHTACAIMCRAVHAHRRPRARAGVLVESAERTMIGLTVSA